MVRIRPVEGARGVAALSVLTFHVSTYGHDATTSGPLGYLWLGVPLFFLLSGFLLFRPFARALIRGTAWPSLGRYGQARFLRIAPAYWLVLTVVAIVETHPSGAWHASANYLLIFTLFHLQGVVPQAWTLCIEIAFYAALPLFALGVAQLTRRTRDETARALLIVIALLPAFPLSFFWLDRTGDGAGQFPIALPGYLDEFAIGMLLAVCLEVRPVITAWLSRALLAAGFAIGAAAIAVQRFGGPAPYSNGAGIMFPRLMEIAFAVALLSVLARDGRTLLGRALSSRPLVAAGTVSYGIYLWHVFVIDELGSTRLWDGEWVGLALTVVLTVAAAAASWFALERPALRLKSRPLRIRRRTALVLEPVVAAPEP